MRTLLVSAALAATLATSSLAFAAMQNVNGTIKTFDTKAMTLTLADGSTYALPAKFKNPGLKAGEKVTISWDQVGSKKVAEAVKIVK